MYVEGYLEILFIERVIGESIGEEERRIFPTRQPLSTPTEAPQTPASTLNLCSVNRIVLVE